MPNSSKPKQVGYSEKMKMPPLGLISIGGYLKMHGYCVRILDLFTNHIKKAEFIDLLKTTQPDMIGISTYTENFNGVIQLTRLIKSICSNCIVVLGGAHVTFLPDEAIQHESVDYISRGEGEMMFVELLEYLNFGTLDIREIAGLSYKENGQVSHNPNRKYIEKLDCLPWAELDEVSMRDYDIKQLIITSRGCPGRCIYCASAALSGTRYRNRSAENVFSELHYKYFVKGEKYFAFLDDTFTASKKRLYKFCEYLKKAKMDIVWRCDSRTDILSEEMIDRITDAGCTSVHIGIESGSQEVINKINKHINLEKSERLLAYMSQKGVQVMCSFIIGHHCDTHETIKQTIDMALRFKKNYNATVGVSINTPFPGTYLYNHLETLGLSLEIKNWSSFDLVQAVFSSSNLTRAEIQNYYYEIQSMTM